MGVASVAGVVVAFDFTFALLSGVWLMWVGTESAVSLVKFGPPRRRAVFGVRPVAICFEPRAGVKPI